MHVLIVDDEPLSRTALSDVLARRSDVEQYDVAEEATQALDRLRTRSYDVLLLDIHMPETSGLELIEALRKQGGAVPAVIFVTAYHDHAVEAFEMRALDYILKPFEPSRVHEALDRAAQRSADERAASLLATLTHLKSATFRSARIAIKVKSRIVFLDPADLITAEASGNYVLLNEKVGSHLLRESISVAARFEKALFASATARTEEARTCPFNQEASVRAMAQLKLLLEVGDGEAEESFRCLQEIPRQAAESCPSRPLNLVAAADFYRTLAAR